MNKKITTFFLLFLIVIIANAQSGKTTIGLTPFKANGYQKYEPIVYENVSSGFVESGRFTIVDRSSWSSIQSERELQKSEEFLDGKIVDQGKSLGAEFIVVGSINSISTAKNNVQNSQGVITGYYYSASISVSLKVVSVETGQASASTTITGGTGFSFGGIGGANSPDAAISKASNSLKVKTKEWIGKAFPVKIKVLKILEDNEKQGVKLVLISGGSNAGINTKNDMKIVYYEDMEIDGKKTQRTIEIAEGKVVKIEDENFSECKILNPGKNGMEVKKKLSEGKTLYVITTE
jgi:hypothetical protein